jgi:hypothetical protein
MMVDMKKYLEAEWRRIQEEMDHVNQCDGRNDRPSGDALSLCIVCIVLFGCIAILI